jgi:hypothetical protein
MWKNVVHLDGVQITIWRTARWIPRATNTHSEYVILYAFQLQQWLHELAATIHYMYNAGLFFNFK